MPLRYYQQRALESTLLSLDECDSTLIAIGTGMI